VARSLPYVECFHLRMEEATHTRCIVRRGGGAHTECPGGIVAGPVLFGRVDVATYALVRAAYGDPQAVTVDLTLHCRLPVTALVLATALPLKFGRAAVHGGHPDRRARDAKPTRAGPNNLGDTWRRHVQATYNCGRMRSHE
jgi:acyl-coenzyme A thioesterase PaaI-like protein